MKVLNLSALVVTPKQRFLDWLHTADPTSRDITLQELAHEPSIYLIPECGSDEELDAVLPNLCEEIFTEQLDAWY